MHDNPPSASRILIVDDTPANIDVLDQMLEAEGHQISVAASGEAALDLAPKIAPDLILLDIMMPGIDGFETCRRLTADPATKDIPVLFITAKSDAEDVVKGFSLGAVDYIAKPFREQEVLTRVRFHLQRKHLIEEMKDKNRKLTEVNDLKNKFLGMASHDLKNPITSIRGYARILLDQGGKLPEETRTEFLEAIHEISGHMLELLGDLLNISMIESGHLNLCLKNDSLAALVEERLRVHRFLAEKKNIVLHASLAELPPFAFDASRIGQAIDNLLSNAIKFSPPDKNIHIALEDADGHAKFSVRDEGPGLSQEDQGKLFGPFQKLANRPTGDEPSHGLGLAITKKMVEAHHGRLSVESAPGAGSTFSFEIPMQSETP